MHDPYFDRQLDLNAFPPVLRVTSIVLSILLVAALGLATLTAATPSVAALIS